MKNKPYPYFDVPEMNDIKDMIFRNAREIPDYTAFVYPCETGEMRKTFLDLKDDVVAFGTWMYSKKLKDKRVAIVGENSYEWLVIYLATVCGGSVAVAIDKGLPEDEITNLAKLADVDTAFVSGTYFDKVGKKICKKSWSMKDFETILSDGRQLIKDGASEEFVNYEMVGERVSTILFTSGTSGVSKAVQLSNKNITYEILHTSMLFQPKGGVL
ncbi:MAG: acyl--CoA ligase, partial [Eubacterium sp.]|nr:acyl--CoA ligase [Eubacterium sp.]